MTDETIDPRGGHNRTRCTALTLEGHRCTKKAKEGRDLCGTHLRAVTKRPQPDTNTQTGKAIALLGELDVEDASVADIKAWLIAVVAGAVKEQKQTGGEGGLVEVTAALKDRLAAANLLYRIVSQEGEGMSNADKVFDLIAEELGYKPS